MLDERIVSYLDLIIRARYPLLLIVSAEEEPVEEAIVQTANIIKPTREVLFWDLVGGWEDNGQCKGQVMSALQRIVSFPAEKPAIFVLKDMLPILQNSQRSENYPVIRQLKRLVREGRSSRKTIILLSHVSVVPAELKEEMVIIDFPLPGLAEIQELIRTTVPPERLKIQGLGQEQLIRACQGLTRQRIQRILARALAQKNQVTEKDIDLVLEEKKQYIRQTEILEFYPASATLSSVGGLENLKEWVRQRRNSFGEQAAKYGLPTPKGVLLVGIQGTGKSLSAKTIAQEWRMPLLRLDAGRLFGGIVGESEGRTRQMIQIAEAMAPCVLWLDEIDKAFGGVGGEYSGDSGTSKRVFGGLITWMQEKTKPVFIVATANNVQVLPAELLRKGRFDEIFFLNLPTEPERREIWRVHLERVRPSRIRDFQLDELARYSEDFSGAEIEQCVYDAMHRAFNEQPPREFQQGDILHSINQTVPLASIAKPQIEALKRWAAESGARVASRDEHLVAELNNLVHQRGLRPIEVDTYE
jgi:SpoVK/Ycf46/Vps4 family AAA+-type ATPase